MKIAEYSVRNPQLTFLLFLMVAITGVYTLITMPRSEDPDLEFPEFPVIVIYPGTSPADMEELIVEPIEKKLSGLEDVKKIKSEILDGLAIINVAYKHGSNVDSKYQEMVREVNNLKNDLPADIYSIEVKKIVPSNVNVLQVAFISENAPLDKLREKAEDLKDELSKLPELKNIQIHGLPDKVVNVELKFDKMAAMGVPVEAVLGSIQSEGLNIPGGNINANGKSFNIKTSGKYKSIEEIKSTIVYSANDKNIFLRDIATVFFEFEKDKYTTRLNGHRSILVTAAQKAGLNITQTRKKYLKVLEEFDEKMPSNIDMVHHFDQGAAVNNRLQGLGIDFLIAIGLVIFTLLPLGNRPTLIVMMSIPLSLSIGVVLINLLGFNLNQLSIVGFVVALGLVVDDSIVVIENIERWMREGATRMEAALKATKQIGLAVLGCTATLVIAFLPLAFLPEASGDFIRSIPAAVISSVLASMVVSLTIIPFLSSRILKEHHGKSGGNIFLRPLQKGIHATYGKFLDKALERPVLVLTGTALMFIGSLSLIPVVGTSLFPASEKPQFLIDITAPPQSNLAYTNEVTRKIETELKKYGEIQYFTSNVGRGNPQVYYNVPQGQERNSFAQIFVQLHDGTNPSRKLEIIEELRKRFTPFPGARVEVKNFEQGPPVTAPVEVRLFGDNLDTLRRQAAVVEKLLRQTEGTIYVKNPLDNLKSDIRVNINKEKAYSLGIPTVNIAKTVRLAVAGFELGQMTDEKNENYDIIVTKMNEERNTLSAFDNLYINNLQGKPIPLSQVAELTLESSPVTIDHLDKIRTVSVSSFVEKGYLNSEVINAVMDKMSNLPLPAGYYYEMGGEYESRNESFGGFGLIIMVTVFLFFVVLILEFKTFKSTIIVLSVLPLGMVGAILALLITGNTLSFVAVVGLVALAGIEVKNTILLVDFTNQMRQEGKPLEEAIRLSGEVRFLPVVLTSLTAIGGFLPIAISTNPLISPLAIVLIGGLISSTLLSRVVTPVIYKLIPPKID